MIAFSGLRFRAISICALALLCCGAALAQKDTGSIAGTVKDSSGASVAGAKVTVADVCAEAVVLKNCFPTWNRLRRVVRPIPQF
jgi:hypothetical protein